MEMVAGQDKEHIKKRREGELKKLRWKSTDFDIDLRRFAPLFRSCFCVTGREDGRQPASDGRRDEKRWCLRRTSINVL